MSAALRVLALVLAGLAVAALVNGVPQPRPLLLALGAMTFGIAAELTRAPTKDGER